MTGSTWYQVRLSVPRVGGWRAWGTVSAEFERRLAEQQSPAITLHVDSWVRRGRDYLQAVIAATVDAADVADALDLAWQSFRKAAGDDTAGWTWPPPRQRSALAVHDLAWQLSMSLAYCRCQEADMNPVG